MSDLFPKWTNRLPLQMAAGLLLAGTSLGAGLWYFFTPKYVRVGYQPLQPVPFSHAVHVQQLGLDCRYCHHTVDQSWYANLPAASTCINCHSQVLPNDARLAIVRDSYQSGTPILWVQIHKLPDYVYFNHAVHLHRGVSCVVCHGRVDPMEEVSQTKSLSMDFCLSCHRDPAPNLRPLEQIYNMEWTASTADPQGPRGIGSALMTDWNLQPSPNCSACHR
jgi:hypothetical protein